MTIAIFLFFVGLVIAISAYTSRKASSLGGYYTANSSIPWGVNGIAFAGGYLSVASFLGICGLIAFYGYDGFLYSIGFLAGWIIALFVIAEPMKRMGTFTFSDALNHTFKHRGIHLAAGLSILVVSLFYLVPQMVGAGVLIEPLLGISHYWGVIIIGTVVILIVAGGGMTSTTYVQFFNGGLLLVFAAIMTGAVLLRGVNTAQHTNEEGLIGLENFQFRTIDASLESDEISKDLIGAEVLERHAITDRYTGKESEVFYRISHLIPAVSETEGIYTAFIKGRTPLFDTTSELDFGWKVEVYDGEIYIRIDDWWRLSENDEERPQLVETQFRTVLPDGHTIINGAPESNNNRLRQMGGVARIPEAYNGNTGPVDPVKLLTIFADRQTVIQQPKQATFPTEDGSQVTIHYEVPVSGSVFMRSGLMFPLEAREGEPTTRTLLNRINFLSLMLALFLGTAALPHILIRYYTVPDADAARKSTIVAIAGIGLFYILTMYLGLGAVANGALNPETSNMSAPLLARSFGEVLFALISGIAFTTVLATTSGLIMAASGAVAHDLMSNLTTREISDKTKVLTGRIVAVVVGAIGIVFGISFRDLNVSFLVGWAFAVAASANLPSLIMMLFWKKVTAQGIIASILVGIFSSVGLIMLSPDMWARYGLDPANAPMPINQPAIVSVPLSFLVLVVVSLTTKNKNSQPTMN